MQTLDIVAVGTDYEFTWFDNGRSKVVNYDYFVDYRVAGVKEPVRVAFGTSNRYDRNRRRVIVWVDGRATGFLEADDYKDTGDMLFGMNQPGLKTMARHTDQVPTAYAGLPVVEYRARMKQSGVPHAWAVVANIADHTTMIKAAIARRGVVLQLEEYPSEQDLEVQPI